MKGAPATLLLFAVPGATSVLLQTCALHATHVSHARKPNVVGATSTTLTTNP